MPSDNRGILRLAGTACPTNWLGGSELPALFDFEFCFFSFFDNRDIKFEISSRLKQKTKRDENNQVKIKADQHNKDMIKF